jgi:hypothetical protein
VALVEALPLVAARIGRVPTLVGGLAVLTRLRTPHRATHDVDLVDRHGAGQPPMLELLAAPGDPDGAVSTAVVTPSGLVQVDVLEVADVHLTHLPDYPTDRLHVLAHDWAARTAEHVRIVAWAGEQVRAEAVTLVAGAGPLVATKLQSAMNRGADKQATDFADILRLTFDDTAGAEVVAQLRSAAPGLAADALLHARRWFDERAAETLRTLHRVPAGAAYTLDDVHVVGEIVTAALAEAAG